MQLLNLLSHRNAVLRAFDPLRPCLLTLSHARRGSLNTLRSSLLTLSHARRGPLYPLQAGVLTLDHASLPLHSLRTRLLALDHTALRHTLRSGLALGALERSEALLARHARRSECAAAAATCLICTL